MKQVNMTITDEEYVILLTEVSKYMLETGKIKKVATLAYELIVPAIAALHKANDKPIELGDSLNMNIDKPEPPSDRSLKEGEQPKKLSKGAFDFSALDM